MCKTPRYNYFIDQPIYKVLQFVSLHIPKKDHIVEQPIYKFLQFVNWLL